MTWPGVLGVFRGVRRKRGKWTNEPALTVFVKRKRALSDLAKEHRLRGAYDGVPVDVVAIGRPRTHAQVDATELLVQGDRKSSLSAVVEHPGGGMVALGSGHGLLPVDGDGYESGTWTADQVPVDIDGVDAAGSLWKGATGDDSDYALVRFPELSPPNTVNGHLWCKAPIPVAPRNVQPHDHVQQYSARRRFRVTGTVVANSINDLPVVLRTSDQIDIPYANVTAVVSDMPYDFSVPGDSGSLVFDDQRRALGFIVGAGTDPDESDLQVSFVLRAFAPLRDALGGIFPLFFRKGSN